jgi:hypothetical protein
MYKCRVEKRVLRNATNHSDYTALHYDLEVVIAPECGHVLQDHQWYSGPLTKVIWAVDDECFHCRVEDDYPFSQGREHYSHDWIVENYQKEGWLLCAGRVVRID